MTAPDGRAEGLPNVVLEELALGLPVIGSRHAGIPDAVLDGETGLLVDEGDAAGLESAMLRLADDRALRLRLGANARRLIEERFDTRRLGAQLAEELRAMASAYARIPRGERRAAWRRATRDLLEPPADYGARYRAAWWWKTLRNRFAGEIG